MSLFSLLSIVVLLTTCNADEGIEENRGHEPLFAPIENQYLIFPMLEKDF